MANSKHQKQTQTCGKWNPEKGKENFVDRRQDSEYGWWYIRMVGKASYSPLRRTRPFTRIVTVLNHLLKLIKSDQIKAQKNKKRRKKTKKKPRSNISTEKTNQVKSFVRKKHKWREEILKEVLGTPRVLESRS